MDLSKVPSSGGGRKARKRVGRGQSSGQGKTSGRGHKGQKARAGYSRRKGFEGGQMPLNRRLPKRGFKQFDRFACIPVNIGAIEKRFEAGAEVSPESLCAAGLCPKSADRVKVLGAGELSKALTFKVHAISAEARRKVEAAGGAIELLDVQPVGRRKPARKSS